MSADAVSIPWSSNSDESEFNRILIIMLVIALLLTVVIPFVELPQIIRDVVKKLPPQYAELILEKPEIKPPEPPAPEPEPEVAKVKPKPVPKEKVIQAPVPQTVRQARKKASMSGILAFKDDLMEMRDAIDTSRLKKTRSLQRGSRAAVKIDRSLITSASSKRQANINVSALSRETGGVALAGRATTVVDAPVEQQSRRTGAVRKVQRPDMLVRSIERIRKVFDANKGAIYAIYNRALRKNPDLLGKVVLELVIEPDGRVSACKVLSTDMDDKSMIAKLVRRVQLFDFGEKDVSVTTISYPVHFLPG